MRTTKQERDLIDAMRNFQKARSRMQYPMEFYIDIHERVDNILFGEGHY